MDIPDLTGIEYIEELIIAYAFSDCEVYRDNEKLFLLQNVSKGDEWEDYSVIKINNEALFDFVNNNESIELQEIIDTYDKQGKEHAKKRTIKNCIRE